MVFPVHLQRSAVVAIVDCPDQGQFIGSLSLKQAALQWICLFQEARINVPRFYKMKHACPSCSALRLDPSNAKWTDPRMKCLGTVFAAYHNCCKLEP
jgi:hypothetical protein